MASSRRKYVVAVALGSVTFAIAAFVFFNIDEFEVMYGDAIGFPRWSVHQLPFAIPWAVMGGLAGGALLFMWNLFGAFVRRRQGKR